MKIIKRDGVNLVEFDREKIVNAIIKAMGECDKGIDEDLAWEIAEDIELEFEDSDTIATVETISDRVEELLAENGRFDASRRYILFRSERAKVREQGWEMNDLQKDVYESKYRHNNESFDEFVFRVSGGNEKIAKLIRNKDFLFGGRILAGRGIDRNVSLANCTTLPPIQDNIESIFDTAKQLARMFSYGQGAGIDISNLRHRGAKVNNASKTSTGAVSFMQVFDTVSDVIGAEGRRAALLIAMDADHKDIYDFINVKNDINKINNANISVKVDDEFMKQDTQEKRDVLNALAKSSHATGEPAILAWDNNKKWHLLSDDDEYELQGVNACSEYPTTGYGTCLLSSVNLSNYVLNPYTKQAKINLEKLSKDIQNIVIGMNEVLDEAIKTHPLQEQRDVSSNYRQLGIGIMGLGDAFIKLGIKYGSKESLDISRIIMEAIRNNAFISSINLSKKFGAFPKFNYEKMSKSAYFKTLPLDIQEGIKLHGIYNSSLLSIAPAGTLSLLCDVSNGLEPLFATHFTRTTKSLGAIDKEYFIYPTVIKEVMEHLDIKEISKLPDYCVTAHDIDPFDRIDLQSVLQYYVDLAISSTINLKEEATVETVEEIYKYAHKKGLKGVSIFRDNCLRVGILNTTENKKDVNRLNKIDELKSELDKLALEELNDNPNNCPICGSKNLFHSGGCQICQDCGYSPCSI
ncbi:MAG TPA: ATP cone domain-containing protein [Tissierellaceae bacterium]|nr:ATP cone domain-containing protein [Tissierellaceae bacterium]